VEIAGLAAEIAKVKSRLQYAELQLNRAAYLTRSDTASQQALDQAKNDAASAQADVAEAEANHTAAVAGPTKEERFIADAQVKAAAAALVVLERQLDKTILRAPADGIVSVIVAEIGENVRAGEPVLVIEDTGKQWLGMSRACIGLRLSSLYSPVGPFEIDQSRKAQPWCLSRRGGGACKENALGPGRGARALSR
jgi:HlyD family secretion protein